MDFDSSGKLPAGIHDCSAEEFEELFVEQFPTSQSRRPIFCSLITFIQELFQTGIPDEIWIDGSYATSKINPNDADVVVFLHYPHFSKLSLQRNLLRQKYCPTLDLYFAVAASEQSQNMLSVNDFNQVQNYRNYWRGQFGFDREDNPKGIIRLLPESLQKYTGRG